MLTPGNLHNCQLRISNNSRLYLYKHKTCKPKLTESATEHYNDRGLYYRLVYHLPRTHRSGKHVKVTDVSFRYN